MIDSLSNLSQDRRYWAALVFTGVALEGAALYYQYVLDEWPCVLCIQVRLWVVAFILLGLVALIGAGFDWVNRVLHGLTVVAMLGLAERSWQTLAIERGWVFGECDMDLGLPDWFVPDRWLPWLFEVQTTCGYSPEILFGITIAETLLVFSIILVIITATLFVASWRKSH